MTSKPAPRPTPAPAAPDFTGDEHWGQGGRYIVVDGRRIPAPAAEAPPALPGDQPTVKDSEHG